MCVGGVCAEGPQVLASLSQGPTCVRGRGVEHPCSLSAHPTRGRLAFPPPQTSVRRASGLTVPGLSCGITQTWVFPGSVAFWPPHVSGLREEDRGNGLHV